MGVNSGLVFSLVVLCAYGCQDGNCDDCDTFLSDSAGKIVEICYHCLSGYTLNSNSECQQDQGLIIGIAIGATLAIVAQVVIYILCKIKYGDPNKKMSDLTLEDIYNEEIYQN
jgi:hypothetical protein